MIISKLIKPTCNCLTSCYLPYMIGNFIILNISIFAKGVPFLFLFKLARKGGTAQLAWKKGTVFCKILMFKNHYLVVVRTCNVV